MLAKNAFLFLLVVFFLIFVSYAGISRAQQGSFYFSAGDNKAWYSRSNVYINQNDLGNSYVMEKVKANNETNTPISLIHLNYRLGYYFNPDQTWGAELNFDPVNYQIVNGQQIRLSGTINNFINANRTIIFSSQYGFHYFYDGANLMLLNFVKRVPIYRPNSKKIGIDALGKLGAGPVMPHFQNSLPVNPVDDPQLQWGGWNVGLETAIRVTFFRYCYLEFAGKYDFASLSNLKVYDGTAKQNFSTYEVTGSIGVTFPVSKRNPLFFREHNIITILPLFMLKKSENKTDGDYIMDKLKRKKDQDQSQGIDSSKIVEVPEFQSVLNRKRTKIIKHDSVHTGDNPWGIEDSLLNKMGDDWRRVIDTLLAKENQRLVDSLLNKRLQDSLSNFSDTTSLPDTSTEHTDTLLITPGQDNTDTATKPNFLWDKNAQENKDTVNKKPPEENADSAWLRKFMMDKSAAPAKDTIEKKPGIDNIPVPDTVASAAPKDSLTAKERKKLEKKERKEQKKKEQQEEKERKKKEKEDQAIIDNAGKKEATDSTEKK